jgi:hypothetical protein
MYPRSTVELAKTLSDLGILDRENAEICGVSVGAIRKWRYGSRRNGNRNRHEDVPRCPRCHGRPLDEKAYAYMLGLYLGDGHLILARKGVWVLSITCCDGWPGLMAQARLAMSAVMPSSKVFARARTGCTEIKSTSKHWLCLFPQHGPGMKHQRVIELEPWQERIVAEYPGDFARGLFTPMDTAGSTGSGGHSKTATGGMSIRVICLTTSRQTFTASAARPWTGWEWHGGFPSRPRSRWPGARP